MGTVRRDVQWTGADDEIKPNCQSKSLTILTHEILTTARSIPSASNCSVNCLKGTVGSLVTGNSNTQSMNLTFLKVRSREDDATTCCSDQAVMGGG